VKTLYRSRTSLFKRLLLQALMKTKRVTMLQIQLRIVGNEAIKEANAIEHGLLDETCFSYNCNQFCAFPYAAASDHPVAD